MAAQLEAPVLPPYLYRYRSLANGHLDREIESVRDQYLWCANYRDMNDPMEGFYNPSQRVQKLTKFRRIAKDIFDAKQDIGICSFSDSRDNEIMWMNYANNYQGICIGYKPRLLLDSLSDVVRLVRLGYGTVPPQIGLHDYEMANIAAQKILSHKKVSWSHEREWRVFAPVGRVHLDRNCVASIRLGVRISDTDRERVFNAFASRKIRIYEMVVSDYEHRWRRLNKGSAK